MKRIAITTLMAVAIATGMMVVSDSQQEANAHCQVPCGIYDDAGRIKAMMEDVATIDKAVSEINEFGTDAPSPVQVNQVIRWVNTKEEHASNIIETVSLYFLTQKVKSVPADDAGYQAYLKKLGDHHAVLRAAMTTKQTVDSANVAKLKAAVEAMAKHYH